MTYRPDSFSATSSRELVFPAPSSSVNVASRRSLPSAPAEKGVEVGGRQRDQEPFPWSAVVVVGVVVGVVRELRVRGVEAPCDGMSPAMAPSCWRGE